MEVTPLESWVLEKTNIKVKSREALEAWQLERIRESIAYAKSRSKFYNKRLKNIDEEGLRTIKDFQSIPFTDSKDIKENPLRFLCVPQNDIARIVTLRTSGTSGDDKRLFFTEEDINNTIEFFRWGMSCLVDKKDRVLVLLPGDAYGSIGDLLKKALSLDGVKCIVEGLIKDLDQTAKTIEDNKITCIVGVPIQILNLYRSKSEVFKKNIKKVLLTTDYVPNVIVDELKNKYQCKGFNHYGMTEMGYGGGVDCEALKGYHLRECDLYFEIIDPLTGKTKPEGEYGEIVFTTLNRVGMPLIRYRTGDIAAFSTENCPCGTFLKTMKKVIGRIENKISLWDGQDLYLKDLDETIFAFEEILDYKVYLKGNEIIIKIFIDNHKSFMKIKDGIARDVNKLLTKKTSQKFVITVESVIEPVEKIKNSMVKRKILHFNNGE